MNIRNWKYHKKITKLMNDFPSLPKIVSLITFVMLVLIVSSIYIDKQNSLITAIITPTSPKPARLDFETGLPIAPVMDSRVPKYCANVTVAGTNNLLPRSGNMNFQFKGTDDCRDLNSYVYYKIANANILINENTNLSYKISPRSTWGQNVGIDLYLTDASGNNGRYLRDQQVYAKDAVLMHPNVQQNHASFSGCCILGHQIFPTIEANLGKLTGWYIKEILVAYDDNIYNNSQGNFEAYVDDIKIEDVIPRGGSYPLGAIVVSSSTKATSTRYLYSGPGGSIVGTINRDGASTTVGKIVDGPIAVPAFKNTSGQDVPRSNVMWQIDFDSGSDGWIRELYLRQQYATQAQAATALAAIDDYCLNVKKGDTDCNGSVGVSDGVAVLRCNAGLSPCNTINIDPDAIKKADMDCNGSLSLTDGVNVLRAAAGLAPTEDILACSSPQSGFGSGTTGGKGRTIIHVSNLNSSGPGSLADAISTSNRNIVFDLGGTITLTNYIDVKGSFITIDGASAPFPGITLRNGGLRIRGDLGAHDVVVNNIRVRNAFEDGIQVAAGATNIVIDHVSVDGSKDGNIDITQTGTKDVTVMGSILSHPAPDEKNMLISYNASRISLHHNIFTEALQRNPQIKFNDTTNTEDPNTTVDMRNNLIWNWFGGVGTRIRNGAKANVVNNYYASNGGDAQDVLIICKTGGFRFDSEHCDSGSSNTVAKAFVSGNRDDGVGVNGRGTEGAQFTAPTIVPSLSPQSSACIAYNQAGVRPLDSVDQAYRSRISIPGCAPK